MSNGPEVVSGAPAGRRQLVVARYREDVSWLDQIHGVEKLVYNKFHSADGNALTNIGRESHTYLHYIVTRYDELAEVVIFVQGDPFAHTRDIVGRIHSLGDTLDFEPVSDSVVTCDGRGCPHHCGLPLDESYMLIFGAPEGLHQYTFAVGAQFAVSAQAIRRRPVSVYLRLLNILEDPARTGEFGYVMERMWYYLFSTDHAAPFAAR